MRPSPAVSLLGTGLRTGRVGLTVEVHGAAPLLYDGWEDVVEVSFRPVSFSTAVLPCGRGALCEVDLPPADHRGALLRARNGPERGDRGSPRRGRRAGRPLSAAVLARPARRGPGRPARPHAAPRAGTGTRAACRRPLPGRARTRVRAETLSWGGRLPSRRYGRSAATHAGSSHWTGDLLDAVDAACPATQRSLARWAAHRAFTAAGLDDVDWITPALVALDRGSPCPPRSTTPGGPGNASSPTNAQPPARRTRPTDAVATRCDRPWPCPRCVRRPNRTRCVPRSVPSSPPAVTHGTDYPALFAEARREFPRPRPGRVPPQ
ncbi:hypothetical protein LV779_26655 [Streptomyces thinghirensis]|nr:hypothetical protein [Streptomyces thinghirensis]